MTNKNKPEIRFPGFTEEWERRKLGELVKKQIKGKAQFEKLGVGNTEYLDTNRLNGSKPIFTDADPDVDMDDILILWDGSKAGTVYTGFSGVLGSTLKGYKVSIDSHFTYQFLKLNQENIYANYRTPNIPHVQKDFLEIFFITIPVINEQKKIGLFFKKIDDTIAHHQRELDLLKETKKGFLQKIFPKEGEKVPEVRFPGFTEEWVQRKVLDLSSDTYGGGTPKTNNSEYWQGEIPWIQSSDLSKDVFFEVTPKKYITENAVKNSATKIIPSNSIAIVTRVGVGKLAFMPYEFATSQDFLSLANLKVDPLFGVYLFYQMLKNELNKAQGTSIKGITKSDLLEKRVIIPINFNEQQKIGTFFKKLDDTITLHQRELDLLKETKKGFLQKLFV